MIATEAMIELAAERVERERDLRVAEIQQAARRQRTCDPIDPPTVCRCGEEISAARARAVPGTRQCIDCATLAERRPGSIA